MWRIAIGEPFAPERSTWPDGSFELRYIDGQLLLQICESSPSPSRIEQFRTGAMHIGLHFERGVLFFLFRIEGAWDWSDQAFSIHLVAQPDRGAGETSGTHFTPLSVVLVDADSGLVSALRMVTMSPRFSRAFYSFVEKQRTAPFSPEMHQAAINEVYRRYPQSKALARAAMFRERAGSNVHPV